MAKTLGLDLGIASIGWCLYDCKERNIADSNGVVLGTYYSPYRILDLGCFIFNQIEDPKNHETENVTRRAKRLMRRQRRRKVFRLKLVRELFKSYFHVDFLNNVVAAKKVKESPFVIKVKGLKAKLTPEELMVALYHYAKWRGFKSNRKSTDKDNKDDKVMLSGIANIKTELAEEGKSCSSEAYVTPLLLKKLSARSEEWDNAIHNSGDIYHLTVDRETYEKEIVALLDKQISYGVIDEQFKKNYLKIWSFQRLYSKGPKCGPYAVDLETRIGKCKFDGEKRAPKDSLSARKFVLASALVNLRYKLYGDETDRSLTKEEIGKIFNKLLFSKDITYQAVFKTLDIYNSLASVKSLMISRKEKAAIITKLKKENNIPEEEDLPNDLYDIFVRNVKEATFKKRIVPSSEFLHKAKNLSSAAIDDDEKQFVKSDDFYDTLAKILLVNKDDESIRSELVKDGRFGSKLTDEIVKTDIDSKETIDLSISICRKIVPLMVNAGKKYYQAMSDNGYKAYDPNGKAEVMGHIPPIDDALKEMGVFLANPVVKHTLVQLRKLINAIVDKYGAVDDYIIEMSRELKASKKVRYLIQDNNLENQFDNNTIRNRMIEQFPDKFRNYASIKKNDLIRYKLYDEQGGVSPYTNQPIPFRKLFSEEYQIDHIMPFSQSFDDSFSNKVLVEAKANQEKGNSLPTAFREKIKIFLNNHKFFSRKKKENLLRESIPDGFLNKDFEDSAYIAKLGKDLISFFMLPEGKRCRSTSGGLTDILRRAWRLTGKSHTYYKFDSGSYVSYENNLYQVRFYQDYLFSSVEKTVENGVKSLVFNFTNVISGDTKEVSIELKTVKNRRDKNGDIQSLSIRQEKLNDAIEYYFENEMYYLKHFGYFVGKDFEKLLESITGERVDSENKTESLQKEHGLTLLSEVRVQIQGLIDKKDRSNNLHHAIDAAVIGAVSQGLVQRIAVANRDGSDEKINYQQPYEGFVEEVLARVYERDPERLLKILNSLPQYKDDPLSKNDVHVLVPVRQPSHDIKGPISNETIFGARMTSGGNLAIIKTVPVDKLSQDDLEKIVDCQGGNKAVYDAIKEWIASNKKTRYPILAKKGNFIKKVKIYELSTKTMSVDQLKETDLDKIVGRLGLNKDIYDSVKAWIGAGRETKYPVSFKKGTFIKKVKLYDFSSADNKIRLSADNKRFADNSTVVRVNVYFKPGSENLYFAPIYYYQIWQEQQTKKNKEQKIEYRLTCSRGAEGSIIVDSSTLKTKYKLVATMPKGSLVEVTMKDTNCKKFLGYVVGFSKGLFELESPLGDSQDGIYSQIPCDKEGRIRLTCSTIKTIKVRSISVLGKIS